MNKDEEREVPDPRESIEEIPTVNFPLAWSKSLQTPPHFLDFLVVFLVVLDFNKQVSGSVFMIMYE